MPPTERNEYRDIRQFCFDTILDDFTKSSNKMEWLKEYTYRNNTTTYDWYSSSLTTIINGGFSDYYKINLEQSKGNIRLQGLLIKEIEESMSGIKRDLTITILQHFKAKSIYDIFHPPPVGTPTEIEAIQCFVCATNKKDRALPCGHSYCCCCVFTLPNGKCPECNTVFDKSKVIKLYL